MWFEFWPITTMSIFELRLHFDLNSTPFMAAFHTVATLSHCQKNQTDSCRYNRCLQEHILSWWHMQSQGENITCRHCYSWETFTTTSTTKCNICICQLTLNSNLGCWAISIICYARHYLQSIMKCTSLSRCKSFKVGNSPVTFQCVLLCHSPRLAVEDEDEDE